LLALACFGACAATPKPAYQVGDKLAKVAAVPAAGSFQLIDWDALIPKGWDPMKDFKTLGMSMLGDSDPRAQEALDRLKHAWDTAPTEAAMDGKRVRLAGFVVPLDGNENALREFLLVPYFGGCIHVPPPPANQIVHVLLTTPLKGVKTMDALWVSGTLHVAIQDTAMGTSGYRMDAERTEPYREKK
jgi:hypothetical protein